MPIYIMQIIWYVSISFNDQSLYDVAMSEKKNLPHCAVGYSQASWLTTCYVFYSI